MPFRRAKSMDEKTLLSTACRRQQEEKAGDEKNNVSLLSFWRGNRLLGRIHGYWCYYIVMKPHYLRHPTLHRILLLISIHHALDMNSVPHVSNIPNRKQGSATESFSPSFHK